MVLLCAFCIVEPWIFREDDGFNIRNRVKFTRANFTKMWQWKIETEDIGREIVEKLSEIKTGSEEFSYICNKEDKYYYSVISTKLYCTEDKK